MDMGISLNRFRGAVLRGTVVALLGGMNAGVAAARTTEGQEATVSRTTKAFNYRSSGSRQVSFTGTDLISGASGTAKIGVKTSRVEIDAKFSGMDDPTKF